MMKIKSPNKPNCRDVKSYVSQFFYRPQNNCHLSPSREALSISCKSTNPKNLDSENYTQYCMLYAQYSLLGP